MKGGRTFYRLSSKGIAGDNVLKKGKTRPTALSSMIGQGGGNYNFVWGTGRFSQWEDRIAVVEKAAAGDMIHVKRKELSDSFSRRARSRL